MRADGYVHQRLMPHRAANWIGLTVSYAYVLGFIGVATLLMVKKILAPPVTRKIIHIGVSHWWLIAMALFDDPWIVSIGPASFILFNALAIRLRFVPAMDESAHAKNLGTVYFPISLLVLANLCWRGLVPAWVGGVGILTLGWGDGLAAVVGERFGKKGIRIWGNRKTAAGTATMFAASFIVTLAFTLLFSSRFGSLLPAFGVSAAVAAVATFVEIFTPLWIDNITIPILTALFYWGVFS